MNHQIIGEMMPQLDILCYQVKPLVPGMGYILLSQWPKGYHETPQTLQAIGWSPQPDGKALLLKTTLTYVTQCREEELVPNYSPTE